MYKEYVDTFIGNGEINLDIRDDLCKTWFFIKAQCGNTHPGATLPFGMVSACGYSGGYPCGYGTHIPNTHGKVTRLMDKLKLSGFTHFHHSGTGAIGSYYNYVRVVPMQKDEWNINKLCNIENEISTVGYYSVELPEREVMAELTVDEKAAVHRYSFNKSGRIAIDFSNNGLSKTLSNKFYSIAEDAWVKKTDNRSVSAMIKMEGIPIFVHVLCDCKEVDINVFQDIEILSLDHLIIEKNKLSENFGAILDLKDNKEATIYIGFSLKSSKCAEENANKSFINGFNRTKQKAEDKWEFALGKIKVKSKDEEMKVKFYSALYHSLLKPANFNGECWYSDEKEFYLDFATFWDQYKTQLPLVNFLFPDNASGIINSMITLINTEGNLPVAFLLSDKMDICKYQARMLGDYIIIDAFHKGVLGVDWNKALDAMIKDLFQQDYKDFVETGFTERYTHIIDMSDACFYMAQMAEKLNRIEDADMLLKLSKNWVNAFDANTGVLSLNSWYYEGTNFNYSFRPQHDMNARIELAGGKDKFTKMLDDFFGYGAEAVKQAIDPKDEQFMLWGHALHRFEGYNNEPDMETPFAYLYVQRHDRVCEIIRKSTRSMFNNTKGGLPGNDDSGGLSSCLVWNMLGIFPAVGKDIIYIGSPTIEEAEIELFNHRSFKIIVKNQDYNNIYVDKLWLNGEEINRSYLTISEMVNGGELVYVMADKPRERQFDGPKE